MNEGQRVVRLLEDHLVHPEGEYEGKPIMLMDWQRDLLVDLYSSGATTALIGAGKGNAKTTLLAGLGLYELLASRRPGSPDIPVAAVSYDQAGLLFGSACQMIRNTDIGHMVQCQEAQIFRTDGPGRLYRVAAVAGANDGRRPSVLLQDEYQEWITAKHERVDRILSNGLMKRATTLQVRITVAGVSGVDSPCESLYQAAMRNSRIWLRWYAADPDLDLDQEADLMQAVLAANPAAGPGGWLDAERIAGLYQTIPEADFRRYHLNQWVEAEHAWLPYGAWDQCARPQGWPAPGTEVVLGFDGSYSRDSTAIVGCTLDGYVFVVGLWAQPPGDRGWRVPRNEVMALLRASMDRWHVAELAYDPPGWHREFEELEAEYGEERVVRFPTAIVQRMAEGTSRLYSAVIGGMVMHDGDGRLAAHIAGCVAVPSQHGLVVRKEHKDSARRVDAAHAAIIAHDRATHLRERPYAGQYVL